MNTEFRCESCHKKLFEADFALLIGKKHQVPGETPTIEQVCPRCKHLNVFVYKPLDYVAK